jgi:hypothetical protein
LRNWCSHHCLSLFLSRYRCIRFHRKNWHWDIWFELVGSWVQFSLLNYIFILVFNFLFCMVCVLGWLCHINLGHLSLNSWLNLFLNWFLW